VGCDPNVLYDSEKALKKHQRDVHPSWTPKRCPIEDCGSMVTFKTAQALKTHLQVSHKISDKAVLKSHTYMRTLSYSPQPCSYIACESKKTFIEKRSLINHLEKCHNIGKEDLDKYIKLA